MKHAEKKVEMVTSDDEHWYKSEKLPDVYYPSVTTILSIWPKGLGFNRWLASQESYEASQTTLHTAGDRGTRVHNATEALEKGATLKREDFTIEEWQMLMGFINFHEKYKPEPILIEGRFVSDEQKVGGTIDRLYKIDGAIVLLDIKTSSSIHEQYWIQVGKYALLVLEKMGVRVNQTAILRLAPRKKDLFEYQVSEDWESDGKLFDAVHHIWKRVNPKADGPRMLELPVTLELPHEQPAKKRRKKVTA